MNELQLAVEKLRQFVALDEEASKALDFLEKEASKAYQATSKQTWAINNYCKNNDKELSDLIAEVGITVVNPLRLTKTEASAIIKHMNK